MKTGYITVLFLLKESGTYLLPQFMIFEWEKAGKGAGAAYHAKTHYSRNDAPRK
jgi:hypothetical protein